MFYNDPYLGRYSAWPTEPKFKDTPVPMDFIFRHDRPSVYESRRFAAGEYTPVV